VSRPNPFAFFKQSLKTDAYFADEIINVYLLRPIAAGIVWLLYPTSVTPNQVTIAAIITGCLSAGSYWFDTPPAIALGGVLAMLKDILDDADGQLARAKELYSRRGRFLDSIGDIAVNMLIFPAVTMVAYRTHPSMITAVLGLLSLAGITLRVSYHVYYQTSFLHLENRYRLNRIVEHITDEDRAGDIVALRLQQVFLFLYGWQDRLMYRIDQWCKGRNFENRLDPAWYGDRLGLRLSGLLGFGTEFALLAVCSWTNQLYLYLLLNVCVMNGIWGASVLYRRGMLARNLK